MRAVLILLLRELISAGALSGIARNLFEAGAGGMRERALESFRTIIRKNMKRIILALLAIVFFAISLGFLIAGGFIWLLERFSAAEAAGIVGGLFLVFGALALSISMRKDEVVAELPPPEPEQTAEQQTAVSNLFSSFAENAKSTFGDFRTEIEDLLKAGKGNHSLLFLGLLILLGIGLGAAFKKGDD